MYISQYCLTINYPPYHHCVTKIINFKSFIFSLMATVNYINLNYAL